MVVVVVVKMVESTIYNSYIVTFFSSKFQMGFEIIFFK